jgi:hypothetical protein
VEGGKPSGQERKKTFGAHVLLPEDVKIGDMSFFIAGSTQLLTPFFFFFSLVCPWPDPSLCTFESCYFGLKWTDS